MNYSVDRNLSSWIRPFLGLCSKSIVYLILILFLNIQTCSLVFSRELSIKDTIEQVYRGLQIVSYSQRTPQLFLNVAKGSIGGCGAILGSQYCRTSHSIYLLKEDVLLAYSFGDSALAMLIAHEYAHAVQATMYKKVESTLKSELQADCLAGYFLGSLPNIIFNKQDEQEIITFLWKIGDYSILHSRHHGTPKQRVSSLYIGWKASKELSGVDVCQKI